MATIIPSSTPTRQPFGLLNESKLRHLQSVKNRQNAIITPTSLKTSLKRRAASPENSDSENVDPKSFDPKRKRAFQDDDVSFAKTKPARYSLSTLPPPQGPRIVPATPRLDTATKSITPVSAPPAAGRSPTRRRPGLQQLRRRFVPPTISTKSPSLSIAAALNGTVAQKKARKVRTLEEAKSKSWFFDIYEEPEAVQNDRMNDWTMSQSATNLLDISDDEGKPGKSHHDDRGKENVDPDEVSTPLTRSMAAAQAASEELRKDIMTDDRVPLGEMNPAKYYAEGLDATSVVLVQDDTFEMEAAVQQQPEHTTANPKEDAPFTFKADQTLPIDTSDIAAVIRSSEPNWEASTYPAVEEQQSININDIPSRAPGEDLDIWESESAKDENEKQCAEDCVFALSEL